MPRSTALPWLCSTVSRARGCGIHSAANVVPPPPPGRGRVASRSGVHCASAPSLPSAAGPPSRSAPPASGTSS